ncbi:MAG: hypothetical protein KAR54_01895 [Candidatus Pacebacteria bacterium]|nr:hypothetical protein [Candidatus Paceibacterota bacterium]
MTGFFDGIKKEVADYLFSLQMEGEILFRKNEKGDWKQITLRTFFQEKIEILKEIITGLENGQISPAYGVQKELLITHFGERIDRFRKYLIVA